MRKTYRLISGLAVLLLASSLAMAGPAAAQDAQGADTSTTTSQPAGSTKSGRLAEQFREQAQEKLQQAKADHKAETQAARQTACDARKANLTKRMADAVAQAKKHKAVFDKIYTRVKDFYTNKNLSVSNYADLTAKADAASATAQASIDALSSLDVNVDCTSQTVGASVDAFQAAVKSTRDSLKAYRSAITDLITAIKGASTSATGSSANSTGQ